MKNTIISIYIPELKDNFKAVWNKENKPQIGDIVKVQNALFYGDTTFYSEILRIERGEYQEKARDFCCI